MAWDYLEKCVNDNGQAKCENCGEVYMSRDGDEIWNMKRHMKKHAIRGKISSYSPLSQEKFRKKIYKVLIKHDYHFSFVEHEGIKDL